ncbi:MAG: hypothetical protein DMF78_25840 [Acidobacteria bacterium]|nr:MAG: hypothetical protein DMF78_25840 [Acidobacteriota bacterium]
MAVTGPAGKRAPSVYVSPSGLGPLTVTLPSSATSSVAPPAESADVGRSVVHAGGGAVRSRSQAARADASSGVAASSRAFRRPISSSSDFLRAACAPVASSSSGSTIHLSITFGPSPSTRYSPLSKKASMR